MIPLSFKKLQLFCVILTPNHCYPRLHVDLASDGVAIEAKIPTKHHVHRCALEVYQ